MHKTSSDLSGAHAPDSCDAGARSTQNPSQPTNTSPSTAASPSPTPLTSDRLGQRPAASSSALDLYAEITNQIVTMLEQGVVPWRSPILGQTHAGHPKNLNTGKPYRGVNVFLLAFTAFVKGYESSYWLTFQQVQQRGGTVRRGERSTMVVFFKPYEVTDPSDGETKTVPVLRYFRVFNAQAQCENVHVPDTPKYTPTQFEKIEAADAIVKGYKNGPIVEHLGARAFYRPRTDTVTIPDPTRFSTPEEYYATLMHELAHSTGHSSRLDRKIDTDPKPFGSPDYGKEELIAEMAAAFLCGEAGIRPAVIDNQAAYLAGWLGVLKSDKRLVIAAASAAQRAAEHIRGVKHEQTNTSSESSRSSSNANASESEIEPA
ncbi:MAG: DUF1738 domain-containing protein [Phycisphaerales bacterium]|nr:DUF1738 domain-containing protein [Phycisphaerales bacterium]